MTPGRTATLSLDLDNKWSYLKIHGDPGWESFPSYLDRVVPRILDTLRAHDLTITVLVVGQDATLERNREPLQAIATAGHEIGNHSFRHDPWLHLYSEREIAREIASAEEHIERVTGRRCVGFRGPGFSLSEATLRVLARRGYRYDATTLPSFLGPLARAYYLATSQLAREERARRRALFGRWSDGLQPLKPYCWEVESTRLVEIPVTTVPLLKVPFHLSYVLYLAALSPAAAIAYFRAALRLCRLTGTAPSLLLHPLDFLGVEDEPDLAFFPAMRLPRQRKLEIVDACLTLVRRQFEVTTLERYAAGLDPASLPGRAARGRSETAGPRAMVERGHA
jgi:hypothetical protein